MCVLFYRYNRYIDLWFVPVVVMLCKECERDVEEIGKWFELNKYLIMSCCDKENDIITQ